MRLFSLEAVYPPNKRFFSLICFWITLVVVLAMGPTVVIASDIELRPAINNFDGRVKVARVDWKAIGQVNIRGLRSIKQCSGSLVDNNLVLTSAHCVVNPLTRKPYPSGSVFFVAGVEPGNKFVAASNAKCVRVLADLSREKGPIGPALIILNKPITEVAPFSITYQYKPLPETELTHAGYPGKKRYQLAIQSGCQVTGAKGALFSTDCNADPGSSGGPFLIEAGSKLEVVGVLEGKNGNEETVGVAIEDLSDIISATLQCKD
jgi:protease YdgD